MLSSLYGKDFIEENNEFNLYEFRKIKNMVKEAYSKKPLRSYRRSYPLNLKYGNIIYCQKAKKWFYSDVESR